MGDFVVTARQLWEILPGYLPRRGLNSGTLLTECSAFVQNGRLFLCVLGASHFCNITSSLRNSVNTYIGLS